MIEWKGVNQQGGFVVSWLLPAQVLYADMTGWLTEISIEVKLEGMIQLMSGTMREIVW